MKQISIIFVIAVILTACSATPSSVPTEFPSVTPSFTSTPPSTNTPEPSPTATPVPLGGGKLLTAFYASGSCGSCLVIGNFITGEILFEIPLSSDGQQGQVHWSPDGKHIIYTDMTATRMNVHLFNSETGQSKKLGDYPAKGGTPEHINMLKNVAWSYDGEYVLYDAGLEDGKLVKSYYATKDGVASSYDSGLTNWFPDNKTIFSAYVDDTYNIESQTHSPAFTSVLSKLNATFVFEDFILLEREKTKITAIPFPANWNDALAWQYEILNSQVYTLAVLSKEIKNGKIDVDLVQQINDTQIAIIGSVNISNQFSYFVKLVDMQNLPAEITPDDIFQQTGDTPLVISPDANYYLMGYCTFIELCPNFDPNWKTGIVKGWGFKVINFNGVEQSLPADFSQFRGITKTGINIINRGHGNLLDGVAFYWKE